MTVESHGDQRAELAAHEITQNGRCDLHVEDVQDLEAQELIALHRLMHGKNFWSHVLKSFSDKLPGAEHSAEFSAFRSTENAHWKNYVW